MIPFEVGNIVWNKYTLTLSVDKCCDSFIVKHISNPEVFLLETTSENPCNRRGFHIQVYIKDFINFGCPVYS